MSGRFQKWRQTRAVIVVVLVLIIAQDANAESWDSERGVFTVGVATSLDPIRINAIHSWTLTITRDSRPVEGARITVTGGMPEHDHGLPTSPRVTEEIGEGRYLLEGMRFHMNGHWEITIAIAASGSRDTVIVTLQL